MKGLVQHREPKRKHRMLFVSVVDLGGNSGQNIATRELIRGLSHLEEMELGLVYADAHGHLPTGLGPGLTYTWELPEPAPGTWRWHLEYQVPLFGLMRRAIRGFQPEAILARLGPSLVIPPLLAHAAGIPYFPLIRGKGRWENETLAFRLANGLASFIRVLNIRMATTSFVAFSEIKTEVEQTRGASSRPAVVVPNAVDVEKFRCLSPEEVKSERVALGIEPEGFVFGFAGSLKRRHRIDVLFNALAAHRERWGDGEMLIIGDGPERENLAELAKKLGVGEAVHFLGHVDHTVVACHMALGDALMAVVDPLDPSNPIKCYEYLACGRPVIVTEKAEFEFIRREKLGFTVTRNDPREFAEAMSELRCLPLEIREEMGRRARQHMSAHHTWELRARRVFEEVFHHPPDPGPTSEGD